MKATLACIPCFIRQGLNAARLVTSDEKVHRQVIDDIMKETIGKPLDGTPAFMSNISYRIVERLTGVKDPYKEQKRKQNEVALTMYEELVAIVEQAENPLRKATKIAIAGNIIDLGVGIKFDIEKDVLEAVEMKLAIDDYELFEKEIQNAKHILYLSDNTGEIVFDKILISQINKLGKDITVSVKSGPIINDALMEDAKAVGIDKIARIIETGNNMVGCPMDYASAEFKCAFDEADLIISKGQGNFESLSTNTANIFFLLRAKCPEVACELGVNFLDTVLAKASLHIARKNGRPRVNAFEIP